MKSLLNDITITIEIKFLIQIILEILNNNTFILITYVKKKSLSNKNFLFIFVYFFQILFLHDMEYKISKNLLQ